MNYRQRAYDSYDKTNMNLKITNSYYHFKNIQKIFYRKPQYNTIKKVYSPKSKITTTQPQHNYFVIRENELYKKIINDIRTTKVRPKLNLLYKTKEEKLRDYKRQNRTLENKKLIRENSNFKKRLRNQKSMLRIKDIDKDYKENHLKMLQRLKSKRNFILPPINRIKLMNRYESPRNSRKSSKYDYSIGNSSSFKDGESLIQEKKSANIQTVE
jgi:hypothetical protein